MQRSAIDAAENVRQLSHELHSGVLRHAGLLAALRSYCSEFRGRHGIGLTFHADGAVERLMAKAGPDVALCLYRTAQEALNNVARHSGARHATLLLDPCERGIGIEMRIEDDGRGFDVAAAREAGGLGLLSIDERVRQVRGTSTIERRAEGGTTLRLTVPLQGAPDDVTADRAACG